MHGHVCVERKRVPVQIVHSHASVDAHCMQFKRTQVAGIENGHSGIRDGRASSSEAGSRPPSQ
eukprot:2122237-Rhodomonas_salina.2